MNFLDAFKIHIPKVLTTIPSEGGIVNLLAIFAILAITFVISRGTKDSKNVNNIMVIIKIGVIALFVIVGVFHVSTKNWSPFLPYGTTGVMTGAASVFFAYCGFDATASAAPYVKNPKKALPIGLLVSLGVCTIIYISVSAVLTGIILYSNLNVSDALSYALNIAGDHTISLIVALGSVIGILAVIFASNFATSQIISTMSVDGLLPKIFHKKDKNDVPYISLWVVGIIGSILAGFINLSQLANFASIALLLVYGLVSFSIIIFRRNFPDVERGFKTPLVPVVPILGAGCCIFLMTNLSKTTFAIFGVVLILILISYLIYGKNHSVIIDEKTK